MQLLAYYINNHQFNITSHIKMSNPLIQISNKGDESFSKGEQSLNTVDDSSLKDALSSKSLTIQSNNVISNQKINDEYLLKMDNTINQITNQKVQMVSQLQKIIKEIYHQLDQKNTIISRLEGIAKQQANNLQQQQAKIVELRNQNQRKSDELVKSNQRHNQLLKQNQKKVSQLLQLQKKVAELQTQNYQLIHQTGGKFWKFLQLDEITNKLGKTVNNSFEGIINKLTILLRQNASLNVQLQNKNEQVTQLKGELQKRSAELSDKNEQVIQLKEELQKRSERVVQLSAELSDKNEQVIQLKDELQKRSERVVQLSVELSNKNEQITRLKGELQKKSQELIQLHYQLSVINKKQYFHELYLKQCQRYMNSFINKIEPSQQNRQFIDRLNTLYKQPRQIQQICSIFKIMQDYNYQLLIRNKFILNQKQLLLEYVQSADKTISDLNQQGMNYDQMEKQKKVTWYFCIKYRNRFKEQKQGFQSKFPNKAKDLKQILNKYPEFKLPILNLQNISVKSNKQLTDHSFRIKIKILDTLTVIQKINDLDRRWPFDFISYLKNENIKDINVIIGSIKYRSKINKQQYIIPKKEFIIEPTSQQQSYQIPLYNSEHNLKIVVSFKLRYSSE